MPAAGWWGSGRKGGEGQESGGSPETITVEEKKEYKEEQHKEK